MLRCQALANPSEARVTAAVQGGIMRILWVFPIFVTLSGCAGSPIGDRIAGPEKLAQQDAAYCQSIGAGQGSPQYADCRLRVEQMRTQSHSAAMSGGPTVCNTVGYTTVCN